MEVVILHEQLKGLVIVGDLAKLLVHFIALALPQLSLDLVGFLFVDVLNKEQPSQEADVPGN